jgi:hypothetical protein
MPKGTSDAKVIPSLAGKNGCFKIRKYADGDSLVVASALVGPLPFFDEVLELIRRGNR